MLTFKLPGCIRLISKQTLSALPPLASLFVKCEEQQLLWPGLSRLSLNGQLKVLARLKYNNPILSHTTKIIGWRPLGRERERDGSVAKRTDPKTSSSTHFPYKHTHTLLSLSLTDTHTVFHTQSRLSLPLSLKSHTKIAINYLSLSLFLSSRCHSSLSLLPWQFFFLTSPSLTHTLCTHPHAQLHTARTHQRSINISPVLNSVGRISKKLVSSVVDLGGQKRAKKTEFHHV